MFPAYLLSDPGFWSFSVLYVIVVRYFVKFCVKMLRKIGTPPTVAQVLPTWLLFLFAYLLIEQFFHQAEHVTQIYQFQILGLAPTSSRGFVWFLDDEWNHFVFNGLYFGGLIIVFTIIIKALNRQQTVRSIANVGFIYGFFVLEGWHMVEHTYRIMQHVQGLCDQCAGILDPLTGINRLYLHFFFNLFALLMPAVAYSWFGVTAELKRRFGFSMKKLLPLKLLKRS